MEMFEKILVANRGEIACRIIRTARRMGIATVAVHSSVDVGSLHSRIADESVLIGGAAPADSYLDGDAVIRAALATGASAIHPGYGFLSENPEFAEAVAKAGIAFVGPPPEAIRVMGLKGEARDRMVAAGLPVVPGCRDPGYDPDALADAARKIGFPLLVKPAAGGGGIGMRRVHAESGLGPAVRQARREAGAAFGNESVILEKLIERARHVEVQVFADSHGNFVHLFERDCSLQRRHQKLIEEAPAPGMSEDLRDALGRAAIAAARAVGYVGAGTVEFILDVSDGPGVDRFWFLEMNTRLQVEHPVTEAVTGVDLVYWQFRVAAGERLPLLQDDLVLAGHAIEARLCAEDPANGFLPSPGRILLADFPPAVRVDTGVGAGDSVPSHYDPMFAKIVSFAPTRGEARRRLVRALDATRVEGVRTNRTFLRELAGSEEFAAGVMDTGTVDRLGPALLPGPPSPEVLALAAIAAAGLEDCRDWATGFSLWQPLTRPVRFADAGTRYEARVTVLSADAFEVGIAGDSMRVNRAQGWSVDGRRSCAAVRAEGERIVVHAAHDWHFERVEEIAATGEGVGASGEVRSPMSGLVTAVHAAQGDAVSAGQPLVTVEAMKMEHRVDATLRATVSGLLCAVGDQVDEGALLLTLESRK